MSSFLAPKPELFYKSPRPRDARLGEIVQVVAEGVLPDLEPGFVLYGYPDDEGIRANFGRAGASEAPDAIRTALYKMTPTETGAARSRRRLYDLGNMRMDGDLRERQAHGATGVQGLLTAGHLAIALGGGHDYAFADGHGFLQSIVGSRSKKSARPLIINFDAHLDVRPDTDGPNSGSAFYQLLNAHENFDLVEVGLQPHCNSVAHRVWAKRHKNVSLIDLRQTRGQLLKRLKPFMRTRRPTYISVDIDVFSSAFAPGASASYSTGLDPNEFLPVLHEMLKRLDVRVFGVYEVSPPLDFSNKTSQLAAILVHALVSNASNRAMNKEL